MNRFLWTQSLSEALCPAWPCPICKQGTLSLVPKALIAKETVESKRAHSHDDWDPEWIQYNFTAWAKCGRQSCQQEFAIAGTGRMEFEQDDEGRLQAVGAFQPLVCTPMPDIIALPAGCPDDVVVELRRAFTHYWADPNACANGIRVSLECLMTHLGIPKQDATGGNELKLHTRIELYRKNDPVGGAQLMALKWVGNSGSHQGKLVTQSDLLDGLEVLEHALIEIVEKRSARIAALAQSLITKHS